MINIHRLKIEENILEEHFIRNLHLNRTFIPQ